MMCGLIGSVILVLYVVIMAIYVALSGFGAAMEGDEGAERPDR
jgi:hypothetical protein